MKKNRIGKIIGFIGLCIFLVGVSYMVTSYLDKNLYLNTNLEVTFEDTKDFSLENTKKLTKEEALKEYPNIIKVENKSLKKVNYQVELVLKEEGISKEKVHYVLYLNDKEIKEGTLDKLEKNILYNTNIGIKKIDTYKLYLYLEEDSSDNFNYSILINSK